jgi:hypothetical protein
MSYECQIYAEVLAIKPATLQHNFVARRGACKFKRPKTSSISQNNREKRVPYGYEHKRKTVNSFWQYIGFTDEAHFNTEELT